MPVIRKLANDIMPWFVSAEELAKKPLYRAHAAYSWTRDILAGLSGFGMGHPLAKAITGESTDIGVALRDMPPWLYILTGASAVMWVVLKTYVTKDDGEKRAMLARGCRKEFMSLNLRLMEALQDPHPIHAMTEIQAEVMAIVDRHIAEGSWHFPNDDVLAPDIHERVQVRTSRLVHQNIMSWEGQSSHEGGVDQVDPTFPGGTS